MTSDLVERLREPIIAEAFAKRNIVPGALAERLAIERGEAAARIEQLEREKACIDDALKQQTELNLKYTFEYNEVVAERNAFAARIEQLEEALRNLLKVAEGWPVNAVYLDKITKTARAALEDRT